MTQPLEALKNHHDKYGCGAAKPAFTFESTPSGFTATCKYKSNATVATCRSKKDAQREAACKMLEKLQPFSSLSRSVDERCANSIPKVVEISQTVSRDGITLTDSQKVKALEFIKKYCDDSGFEKTNRMKTENEIIGDINIGLKRSSAPQSLLLKNFKNNYQDAIDHFLAIMKEMNLEFCCEVPEVRQDAEAYVVILRIAFNGIMAGGCARTFAEAAYKACEKMIETLLILTE